MRKAAVILSMLSLASCAAAVKDRTLLEDFLCKLDSVDIYVARKEAHIDSLKRIVPLTEEGSVERYEAYLDIGTEYSKFIADSTIRYCTLAQQTADSLSDPEKKFAAMLVEADVLSSTGYYMEADDVLRLVPREKLEGDLLAHYYQSYSALYHGLYNSDKSKPGFHRKYADLYTAYRDSMLVMSDTTSDRYMREVQKICAREGKWDEALRWNERRLAIAPQNSLTRALVLYDIYTLSHYYQGKPLENDIDLLLESATIDLHNANQDVASCLYLESYLTARGDVKDAKKIVDYKNATLVKMGSRTGYLSGFEQSVIISQNHLHMLAVQRRWIHIALTAISLMLLLMAGILVMNIRARKKIERLNKDLDRSDKVSKSYIVGFFQLYSSYIERLMAFRAKINTSLRRGNTQYVIEQTNPSKDITNDELRQMYRNFDAAFIDIFPDFVEQFNSFLRPECRIKIKSSELMNMELRIFALIKLGVTDSQKISELLHCSIKTVYNKRSEITCGLAVPREEFEAMLLKI